MTAEYGAMIREGRTIRNTPTTHCSGRFVPRAAENLPVDSIIPIRHSLGRCFGLAERRCPIDRSSLILNPLRQRDNYAALGVRRTPHYQRLTPFGSSSLVAARTLRPTPEGLVDALSEDGRFQTSRWNTGASPWHSHDAHTGLRWENQSETSLTRPARQRVPGSQQDSEFFGAGRDRHVTRASATPIRVDQADAILSRLHGLLNAVMGVGKRWKMPYSEGNEG